MIHFFFFCFVVYALWQMQLSVTWKCIHLFKAFHKQSIGLIKIWKLLFWTGLTFMSGCWKVFSLTKNNDLGPKIYMLFCIFNTIATLTINPPPPKTWFMVLGSGSIRLRNFHHPLHIISHLSSATQFI